MENNSKIFFLSIAILPLSIIGAYNSLSEAEAATGINVPLYIDHRYESWDILIHLKNQYPNVPVIAIINPHNGPAGQKDHALAVEVEKLQTSGIKVLGYTPTNYGKRDINLIFNEINKYTTWYKVDGIFFDEVKSQNHEITLKTLDEYAKAKGASYTMGNPGTDIPYRYIGILDNYMIYDNKGLPTLTNLKSYAQYDKKNFSISSYGVSGLNPNEIKEISNYIGYIYITHDDLPNPWNTLSIYLENLFSTLSQ